MKHFQLAIGAFLLGISLNSVAVPIIVEAEDSPPVSRLTGSWAEVSDSNFHDGVQLEATATNSRLRLTFTTIGGDFSIFGETTSAGTLQVTIGASVFPTIDISTLASGFQQEIFSTNLAAGVHTATVRLLSGTAAVDYFQYEGMSAVPEPTTLALMGLGLAGLGFTRHRKKWPFMPPMNSWRFQ